MSPDQTPRIRPATTADGAFIRSLTARFADSGAPPWRDPARLAYFHRHGVGEIAELVEANSIRAGEVILVATDPDGARLGFIHLRPDISGLTLEEQGYVNALAVTAEAEGRGAGRALLAAGEDWARECGYHHLTLETFGGNAHARAFYRRLGYEEETLKLVKVL
jgi:ribosomal protein S18 acetylase RimI-like enzyme